MKTGMTEARRAGAWLLATAWMAVVVAPGCDAGGGGGGGLASQQGALSLTRSRESTTTTKTATEPLTLAGDSFGKTSESTFQGLSSTEPGRAWVRKQLASDSADSLSLAGELVADKGVSASSFSEPVDEGGGLVALSKESSGASLVLKSTWLVETPDGQVDLQALSLAYAPPQIAALLGGDAETGTWVSPELEEGPHVFVSEVWETPLMLTASTGSSGGSAGFTKGGTTQLTTGGTTSPLEGGPTELTGGLDHVVRYACCNGVVVREEPDPAAAYAFALQQGQAVWVTDLTPGTGLQTAMSDIAACAIAGDASGCGSAITQLSQASNLVYFAEVFEPVTGEVGYVPIQSLFVRPVTPVATTATFEATWGLLAAIAEEGLTRSMRPLGCGDPSNVRTVSAGSKDIVYNPTSRTQATCDSYLDCPDWVLTTCPEDLPADDPAFAQCRFESQAECIAHAGSVSALLAAHPDREPSLERYACVKNVCPHKGTCGACRAWMEETGQDVYGLMTTEELIQRCEDELYAESEDGDLPIQCIGGTKPNCVDYCHQAMNTQNVFACAYYIPAWESRVFADSADYECGEYPMAATHPGYRVNLDDGGWVGSPDPDHKVLTEFELFEEPHRFEMGRLGDQEATSVWTPDLSAGHAHTVNLGHALGAANVWLSLDPGPTPASVAEQVEADDMLWFNVCAHLPGVGIYGPDNTYEASQTPMGLIAGIDFGQARIGRADICALGGLWFDEAMNPHVFWADGSVDIDVESFTGVQVTKGASYWALAIGGSLIPVLGNIVRAVVITEAAVEGLVETVLGVTDAGAWFANAILHAFEAQLGGELLRALTDITDGVLADAVDPDVDGRLQSVCDQLQPTVPSTHPYYYFYLFLSQQCAAVAATHEVRPFQRNAASAGAGCYGPSALFTPADAGGGHWWESYIGQQWWMPFVPDTGCRMGVEFEAPVDIAVAPVLRCGVGVFNVWLNAGLRVPPESDTASGLGFLATKESDTPTQQELIEQMGELPYMMATYCSGFGHLALESLFGDGLDLAELYLAKHPSTGGFAPAP